MADEAAAAAEPGEGEEEEVPKETVPEQLTLPLFWQNERLSDCLIKLPAVEADPDAAAAEGGEGGEAAEPPPPAEAPAEGEEGEAAAPSKPREWKCHKVILCAASDFFYEQFILGGASGGAAAGGEEGAAPAEGGGEEGGGGGGDEITIPSLPNDPIVRKELDLTDAVPLALRYCYCNQDWTEIEPDIMDPVALFAVATLLKIKSLVAKTLEHIEENVLSRETCATLFYHATLLGSGAADLCEMARQALLNEYCYLNADDHAKLVRLPMTTLLPLLQDDDLLVQDEGEVYSLVNKVLRTRLPRKEQTLTLNNVKIMEAQYFVNQPALFEVLVVESGCAICEGSYYPAENEKYASRTTERLTIEPGTRGEFPFPEEEGYALSLEMPSLYNTNVSALQAPDLVIRALKEILPAETEGASEEVKVDNALRYEVIAEGVLPREAFVKQPSSPSARKRLGLPALDATSKEAKPVSTAEETGEGGAGEENAEAAEDQPVYSVTVSLKGQPMGEIQFSVTIAEKGTADGEEGAEGAAEGAGEEAAPPAEAPAEGEEGAEGGAEEDPNKEPEVKAGLPLDEVDVDALLDAVRFPFLQHQTLVDAARDPVLHEANAQHLVVEALSSRLSAYEPGGVHDECKPRNSLMRALVPVKPGGRRKSLPLADPKSPLKTMKIETKPAPVLGGAASLDNPFVFEQEKDFDTNGLLFFLATKGKTAAWKNPQGLGQVQVLKSGVGFGKSEDLVGREAINLRTQNTENSFFGVDLLTDRLFVCAGYCLRSRNTTSHALVSWQFQGSKDPQDPNAKWIVLDEQRQSKLLVGKSGATAYFDCTLPINGTDQEGLPNAAFRAFRVVQVGKNSSGSYNLGLSGVEIYGKAIRGNYP
ncbi:unnamed protein product [Amoebophrya sp. A120]|nr:unnamed protein product [Amoebophrya sp. A120]|eukprot:GSA120T00016671001.1